ncbi:MAG TPA: hypothetical protein VIL74_20385 [Pyrinomonadaceae bacterium]|jgi:predicted enzyme related to lactoylglutathione lyase
MSENNAADSAFEMPKAGRMSKIQDPTGAKFFVVPPERSKEAKR